MPVPSYDDLTPSISDVHPRDTFDQITRLVPSDEPVVSSRPPEGESRLQPEDHLFACIRAQPPLRASTRSASSPAVGPALCALARDFSPRIERYGDTCVVLDVSGLGRLLGDADGIGAELGRSCAGHRITACIAVAPTQIATLLLSLAGGGVVTDGVAAALAPLPLDTLNALLPDTQMLDILRRWGLRAVGEFAALPADDIAARFGQHGVALQRLARGVDARPLVPDPGTPRFVRSMDLEWPIEALEPLSFVFARLLEPLSAALERADRAAAAIRVDLRLVDKTSHSRMLQLPAPIRDPRVLRTLLLLDLESHPPSAGIDVVTIEIDPAPSRIVQYSLLQRAIPSPETLSTLTARLSALVGEFRCGSPSLLDSHRPDAFQMCRFNPADAEVKRSQVPTSNSQLPNKPESTGSLVLRRFRPPVAMRVTVDHGHPAQIANLRKGIPNGRVVRAAGPWRSSGCWWTASGQHWDRDEWDVALSDGSLCRVYQDRVTGRWFLDGVVD